VPVLELESFDAQMKLLSGIPEAEQVALLEGAVDGYDEGQALVRGMLDAWRRSDAAQLASLIERDTALGGAAAVGLKQRLLEQRNQRMAARLREQLARPGVVFVVVGAGHLVGEDSVVSLLRRAGFAVAQVDTRRP
jgi:uncharacterized protein YbaP (TraB family)